MAFSANLTQAAERLIADEIDSVGALDLLLLVHGQRQRDWGTDELCAALRGPSRWVANRIARFEELGLLTEVSEGRYRYRPGGRHGPTVDQIARVVTRDRAAITRLIFARPPGTPFAH